MIIRQRYLQEIVPFIDNELIKVIVGVRRCGKTVLLSQIQDLLMERGVRKEQIISLNFESLKFQAYKTADALYQYISDKANSISGKKYIFMDEIQEVADWPVAVNSFRVDFDCDLYITGSNSRLLSGELATVLSGRYVQIKLLPFTFSEVCQLEKEQGNFQSNEQTFADYLKYGGFPQRCLLPDEHSITTYLMDLYDAVFIRDIVNRHKIKDIGLLKNVLAFMLDNVGNPFSARKITGKLLSEGIRLAPSTLLNYIEYFKEAFILYNASRYDIKGKELLSSTEKYYAIDLGLRNIVKKSEIVDSSKLYENAVYLEMKARGYEIQVGKLDDNEIDFICTRGKEKLYIQVAYMITEQDQEREFGNLEKLNDNYPKYVISSDLMDLSRNGIIHKNIIQFLLD